MSAALPALVLLTPIVNPQWEATIARLIHKVILDTKARFFHRQRGQAIIQGQHDRPYPERAINVIPSKNAYCLKQYTWSPHGQETLEYISIVTALSSARRENEVKLNEPKRIRTRQTPTNTDQNGPDAPSSCDFRRITLSSSWR